jgi:hypothetical protein
MVLIPIDSRTIEAKTETDDGSRNDFLVSQLEDERVVYCATGTFEGVFTLNSKSDDAIKVSI